MNERPEGREEMECEQLEVMAGEERAEGLDAVDAQNTSDGLCHGDSGSSWGQHRGYLPSRGNTASQIFS